MTHSHLRMMAFCLFAAIFFVKPVFATGPGTQAEVPLPEASPAEAFTLAQEAFAEERYREAYFLFEQACKGGQPGGCFNFALMLDYGVGAPENPERAKKFYTMACEGKVPEGCRYLGLRLRENEPVDPPMSLASFEKACKLGDAEGCFMAAFMFEQGEGAPINSDMAVAYYKKACDWGYARSCEFLNPVE